MFTYTGDPHLGKLNKSVSQQLIESDKQNEQWAALPNCKCNKPCTRMQSPIYCGTTGCSAVKIWKPLGKVIAPVAKPLGNLPQIDSYFSSKLQTFQRV